MTTTDTDPLYVKRKAILHNIFLVTTNFIYFIQFIVSLQPSCRERNNNNNNNSITILLNVKASTSTSFVPGESTACKQS